MRIAFNLKYFQAGRIGGQESVLRQLAAGLDARPLTPDQQLFALCPSSERDAVTGMCAWEGVEHVAPDESHRGMARAVRRLRPDLYLCPLLVIEPPSPPCPTVVSVPDLQHETYPELFAPETLENRRRTYAHAVAHADLILTISGYARGTILECYPNTDPERIVIAPPGIDPALEEHLEHPVENGRGGFGLPDDYLLYPANFWPHKNHARLLEALAELRKTGLEPFLVLTGDSGSGFDSVRAQIEQLDLAAQVRFLGRLPAADFAPLMRGARAVIFPSLYEGFGLPVLEAFHCDTPVLCSNVTSCPEVAGDAALFVDPASVESLAAGLRRIWTDAGLRASLVEKGRVRRAQLARERSFETVRAALLRAVRYPKPRPGVLRRLFAGAAPC